MNNPTKATLAMPEKTYYVYMLTNRHNRVLYTGVTNDLVRRLYEHRNNLAPGFTSQYRCHKLVWCELYDHPQDAIQREKQLKKGSRKKKIALIEAENPSWEDLMPW
ncbi:GIY-YIG nuclease family protein [Halomonas garicola]|uniref:GIY-YIG nuclease family protein n=1 Tax=Halomonas garicola TaxID=1690008 RepID=UPI0028A0D29C|nr:GIY-YIG nuclease family protein [Halomonas garicola]